MYSLFFREKWRFLVRVGLVSSCEIARMQMMRGEGGEGFSCILSLPLFSDSALVASYRPQRWRTKSERDSETNDAMRESKEQRGVILTFEFRN